MLYRRISAGCIRPLRPLFSCLALCAAIFQGSIQAAPINLIDGNSAVTIDPTTSTGLYNWAVDGQTQANRQWFWFRVGGAGGEAAINTISAPVVSQPDASK